MNWASFNIGKATTLDFDQSAGGSAVNEWVAFNKVNDPSGVPSRILGSINAQGQVYVINENGIIFGGASQINVHTLVASSLAIDDGLISRGLLNNPDGQFLFSSIAQAAGTNTPAMAAPTAPATATGLPGDVVVDAGAQLSAPTNADHIGGRVALVGENVTNNGTISTPTARRSWRRAHRLPLRLMPRRIPACVVWMSLSVRQWTPLPVCRWRER